MLNTIIEEFEQELNEQVAKLKAQLDEQWDLKALEEGLMEPLKALYGELIQRLVQDWLSQESVREILRELGGRLGRRYKEDRTVRVQIGWGVEIELRVPYFIKARPAAGRRRRGRGSGRGAYLGLEVLGIRGRCSALWLGEVVELALLCPSLAVAQQVLARRGVSMDIKRLRRLCGELGWWGLKQRGVGAWERGESWSGYTLVISVDGGRVRERRAKRGRKPKGKRRQGYHTEWREPKLMVMYLIAAEGQVVKEFEPIYDATMSGHEGLFWILGQYLSQIDLDTVAQVVFCGDGAPWIWNDVQTLCQRRGLEPQRVHQVLDYTHAKQNLQALIELLPARVQAEGTVAQRWKDWLWQGQLEQIHQDLRRQLRGRRREQALRKWASFFALNAERMQYARFRELNLPCGSGAVESAIRRVINLRLKGPGLFWTREMAENFLFLRAQLLSGRWAIFLHNVARSKAQLFAQCRGQTLGPAANNAVFAPATASPKVA